MRKESAVFPAEAENRYEYSRAVPADSTPRRRQRRWLAPFLCVFGFAAAAALSVSALLARADLTILRDECNRLEEVIVQLADARDHLIIERGIQLGVQSAQPDVTRGSQARDWAEIIPVEGDGDAAWDKISDAISSVSEYFARTSQ